MNIEMFRKELRKINPDFGPCFIHTFITYGCSGCIYRVEEQRILYGNVYFSAIFGLRLLEGLDIFPGVPLGILSPRS
jgi:hypothetical protein